MVAGISVIKTTGIVIVYSGDMLAHGGFVLYYILLGFIFWYFGILLGILVFCLALYSGWRCRQTLFAALPIGQVVSSVVYPRVRNSCPEVTRRVARVWLYRLLRVSVLCTVYP
jgi:hypothetical protein